MATDRLINHTQGESIIQKLEEIADAITPSELIGRVDTIDSEISDIVNVYGAKNFIPYPYVEKTYNKSGITWTCPEEGTVIANGTATAREYFNLTAGSNTMDSIALDESERFNIQRFVGKSLVLSVEMSREGSTTTYGWGWQFRDASYTGIGGSNRYSTDSVTITVPQDAVYLDIYVQIFNGATANNIVFRNMMLRLASIQDDTYVSYAKTNKELTDTFTNQVANKDDAYSPSKAYKVGEHCIYNNVLYKCITACSAAAWSVNQNCFEPTTLTSAVTDLNNDLKNKVNKGKAICNVGVTITPGTQFDLTDSVNNYSYIIIEAYARVNSTSGNRKFSVVDFYSGIDAGYDNRYINLSLYYNNIYNACIGISVESNGKKLIVRECTCNGYDRLFGILVCGVNI